MNEHTHTPAHPQKHINNNTQKHGKQPKPDTPDAHTQGGQQALGVCGSKSTKEIRDRQPRDACLSHSQAVAHRDVQNRSRSGYCIHVSYAPRICSAEAPPCRISRDPETPRLCET
eukprot:GHVQ01026811.1.p2 GENE.GHVQ01026811.1~~GHVQ01026811.1.p2  ORF type:complete len:115 (-),score=19.51 GHVQ01026811.1:409-753(-)